MTSYEVISDDNEVISDVFTGASSHNSKKINAKNIFTYSDYTYADYKTKQRNESVTLLLGVRGY